MYKLSADGQAVIRTSDGATIPTDPGNRDYAEYLAWAAVPGNTPDPAAPPPRPEPSRGERIGALVSEAKAELTGASTLAQVKNIFAATLDGLAALDAPEAAP